MASSLGLVTGQAASAGVSFDELLAIIAAVTATGLSTSQSITGIKAALSNILKPTKDAADTAEQLGIQFNAAGLQSLGLAGLIQMVGEKTGGSSEQISKLFGSVEAYNVVAALATTGSEKLAQALAAMGDKTGATVNAFEKMRDNLSLVSQELVNNFKLTFIDAGLKIIDQFTGDVSGITDIFRSLQFSINDGAFDQVFSALNGFGADLETTLQNIAANLPEALSSDQVQAAIGGLLDAFGGLGAAISGIVR